MVKPKVEKQETLYAHKGKMLFIIEYEMRCNEIKNDVSYTVVLNIFE